MSTPIKSSLATMSRKKKILFGTGAVGVTIGAVGVAAALWSANGSGNSQATALVAQTVTVTAQSATADLYPGFSGGDVFFSLTNTNPYPITFTNMTPGTVTSSDPTNCPVSNVVASARSGLNLQVGANASSAVLTIDSAIAMVSAAPDGCQGVTFTVPLTLTGSQDAP